MACTVEMVHRLRSAESIRQDFLEGIRAAIIDKDRKPKWKHKLEDPLDLEVAKMLMPVPGRPLTFERED